ncbi:MAG TPA: DUF4129 domain-containing protein, partial [Thermomicrobiales bacterium]|nr:DUF4129 domain-containing protein [Thermomicrobiales bacterium]
RPPAHSDTEKGPSPDTTDLARKIILAGGGLVIAFGVIAFIVTLWIIFHADEMEEEEKERYSEPNRLHWALQVLLIGTPIAMIAGLIYLMYTHRGKVQPVAQVPFGGLPGMNMTDATPAVASGPGPGLADYWLVLLGLAVLLSLATIAIVIHMRHRQAETEPEPEAAALLAEEVRDAVELSLDDLAAEADPRRAVLAAYANLESVLARHGFVRKPAETPQEFGRRITTTGALPTDAMLGMTRLFELARYSEHTILGTMKADAIAALITIREAL